MKTFLLQVGTDLESSTETKYNLDVTVTWPHVHKC